MPCSDRRFLGQLHGISVIGAAAGELVTIAGITAQVRTDALPWATFFTLHIADMK